MTMRDELIKAAARAMAERKHPGFVRMGGLLDKHIAAEIPAATAALDAILERMKDAATLYAELIPYGAPGSGVHNDAVDSSRERLRLDFIAVLSTLDPTP